MLGLCLLLASSSSVLALPATGLTYLNYLSKESVVPPSWQQKINQFNALYSENDDGHLNTEGYPGIYLPLLGNGYFSHSKGVRSDTYFISGVFNNETTSPSHRARIPATLAVTIPNTTTTGTLLDMKEGSYFRQGLVGNTGATYELKWYAHMERKHLYVMEFLVDFADSSEDSVTISFENHQGLPSEDIHFNSKPISFLDRSITLQCGTTTIPETSDSETIEVCVASTDLPATLTVARGDDKKIVTFITSVHTSIDTSYSPETEGPLASVTLSCLFNALKFQQTSDPLSSPLYESHVDQWNQLWKSGIEVLNPDTSFDAGYAINASLFAMLSSVREDWPHGLAPGGLTNYYNGHSFWDTETWMYPSLLLLYPSLGRSLMQYRYDRIPGAASKAKSYDPPYEGLMFPWESAYTGVETCPLWADTGLREQHISSDVALAIWQYYSVSKDVNWLISIGLPMLTGISDFWVSRITFDSAENVAHINGVIPPDEYVSNCNDSVYTNFAAKKTFDITLRALEVTSLLDTIPKATLDLYQLYSETLYMSFNDSLNLFNEYEGYGGEVIKQADVVLLHYPWGMPLSSEIQANQLNYYSNLTDSHGPAMTWGIHSIGYKDLLMHSEANDFFLKSYQDNIQKPFNVWTETPQGNAGNFITGAGGFLQTVIYGYPGIRITEEELLIENPVCPEHTGGLKVRGLQYLGYRLDLHYSCLVSGSKPTAPAAVAAEEECFPNRPKELIIDVTEINESVNLELRLYSSTSSSEYVSYPVNGKGSVLAIPLQCGEKSINSLSIHEL
jgi:protein-glucosylgalactosylhydroxylysine glucosidase